MGLAGAVDPTGRTVYISPDGDDANLGTLAAPFQTLEPARDEISKAWTNQPGLATGAVVVLRGGTYPITASFKLSSNHSGRADAPIVYRSHPGE